MCTLCTLCMSCITVIWGHFGRVVLDTYFGVILEVAKWVILGHVQNHPYLGVVQRGVFSGYIQVPCICPYIGLYIGVLGVLAALTPITPLCADHPYLPRFNVDLGSFWGFAIVCQLVLFGVKSVILGEIMGTFGWFRVSFWGQFGVF